MDADAAKVCPYCGGEYKPKRRPDQATCGAALCVKAARKARFQRWYEANRVGHQAKVVQSRKAYRARRRVIAYLEVCGAVRRELVRECGATDALLDEMVRSGALVTEPGAMPLATVYRLPPEQRPPRPRRCGPARSEQKPAPTVAAEHVNIWDEPPPHYPPHLPGVAFPLRVVTSGGTELQIRHEHVRVIHALVTRLLGPHSETGPDFSLLCTSVAPAGWGLYVADELAGRSIAGRRVDGDLFGARARLEVLSCPSRFRAPMGGVARSIVRVDAITPVVTRSDGGPARERPSASSLWNALTSALPARLQVAIDRRRVKLRVLAGHTEPASVDLGGKIAEGGVVRGWIGDVVLEVSPVARWLLECAARIGLGGRTAFGFGRIVVTEMPAAPAEPAPPPEREDLIAPGVAARASAIWGVESGAAMDRLMKAIAAATFLSGADGGAEIWEADGLRLVCVPWLGDQVRVVDVLKGES